MAATGTMNRAALRLDRLHEIRKSLSRDDQAMLDCSFFGALSVGITDEEWDRALNTAARIVDGVSFAGADAHDDDDERGAL